MSTKTTQAAVVVGISIASLSLALAYATASVPQVVTGRLTVTILQTCFAAR